MIVYPERGLALNESAAEIVKRCDGTRTVPEIVTELQRDLGCEDVAIEQDVIALIDELGRKGLIES